MRPPEGGQIYTFYRTSELNEPAEAAVRDDLSSRLRLEVERVQIEQCYYVGTSEPLDREEFAALEELLSESYEPKRLASRSFLDQGFPTVIEIGPRRSMETPESTTAVDICHAGGLSKITRLEMSMRYGVSTLLTDKQLKKVYARIYDPMTKEPYLKPLESFEVKGQPEPVQVLDFSQGLEVLRRLGDKLLLAMDDQDLEFVFNLFVMYLRRNPTNVEIFKLAQFLSEHCRHGFFRAKLYIDGVLMPESLMEIIHGPWKRNPGKTVVGFDDNAAVNEGVLAETLASSAPNRPNMFITLKVVLHAILSFETHCYPTGVEPFAGAATGVGGEIRDEECVGRGGQTFVGIAGYWVEDLFIPKYRLPWERRRWRVPKTLKSALEIFIKGSDGASVYADCFGRALGTGCARSFAMELPEGLFGWVKPIMAAGGAGIIWDMHVKKREPKPGWKMYYVGTKCREVGVGGGSGSSSGQGENKAQLDFNAVQRPEPQAERPLDSLLRALIEMGLDNLIETLTDMGAGGLGVAGTELFAPAGGKIHVRRIPVGDKMMTVMVIVSNESQERVVLLVADENCELFEESSKRFEVPFACIGDVTGNGRIVYVDELDGSTPVDLPLDKILTDLPQKTFHMTRKPRKRTPLELPKNLTVERALNRVWRLIDVGSKGPVLTRKVDRSVGLHLAEQPCVGPFHEAVADRAVYALSYLDRAGVAVSVGEQPYTGLIDAAAMARRAITEALFNMAGAVITDFEAIDLAVNWMGAPKLEGQGPLMYDAAVAYRDFCNTLGIRGTTGKDSSSLWAKVEALKREAGEAKAKELQVIGPMQLVITAYALMPDLYQKVTPVVKPGSQLIHIETSSLRRLGGSCLARVYNQVGNDCPDVQDADLVKGVFMAIQQLVAKKLVNSVHDVSDGGLITAVGEMLISAGLGAEIDIASSAETIPALFAEEPGMVVGCNVGQLVAAKELLDEMGLSYQCIGNVSERGQIAVNVRHNGKMVLKSTIIKLRKLWKETAYQLEMLQRNKACVRQAVEVTSELTEIPQSLLTFAPEGSRRRQITEDSPVAAIICDPGSNGDREMALALKLAGFRVWEVFTSDLVEKRINLEMFDLIVFVGGFSRGDVLGTAQGWSWIIKHNPHVSQQFEKFRADGKLILGVCNGFQLLLQLGWIPGTGSKTSRFIDRVKDIVYPWKRQPRLVRNLSGKFESDFPMVGIQESPSVFLKGMEGSRLGMWVAHGEGRIRADEKMWKVIDENKLVAACFVDPAGDPTEVYPFNVNGSRGGACALTSPDGKVLGIMPHPERGVLEYGHPDWPDEWLEADWYDPDAEDRIGPAIQMFYNAADYIQAAKTAVV